MILVGGSVLTRKYTPPVTAYAVPHRLIVRLPLAIVNLNRFATLKEEDKALNSKGGKQL